MFVLFVQYIESVLSSPMIYFKKNGSVGNMVNPFA